MDTKLIRTALHVLGDHVDAKLADEAMAELDALGSAPTLRDTFAAAALTGLLSAPDRDGNENAYARDAYLFADAMLKAREGK